MPRTSLRPLGVTVREPLLPRTRREDVADNHAAAISYSSEFTTQETMTGLTPFHGNSEPRRVMKMPGKPQLAIIQPLHQRWFLVVLLGLMVPPARGDFQVGAAQRDITPVKPVPLWGYGARHDSLSQGVLDPLRAKALVIEAGGSKLAIVGMDLGRGPTPSMMDRIREARRDVESPMCWFAAATPTMVR